MQKEKRIKKTIKIENISKAKAKKEKGKHRINKTTKHQQNHKPRNQQKSINNQLAIDQQSMQKI